MLAVWDKAVFPFGNQLIFESVTNVYLCVCVSVSERERGTILLLLLLLLLQFILLLQVDVRRLHSDDGFVQKTESFLHMFGLHLKTNREKRSLTLSITQLAYKKLHQ